jgi:hypothetical protein
MRVRRWSFRQACEEVERYLGLEPAESGRCRPQLVSTGNGSGCKLPAPPSPESSFGISRFMPTWMSQARARSLQLSGMVLRLREVPGSLICSPP